MTNDLRPMFGAHALQPEGLRAVYGGRWIVTQDGYVDIVPDRHGTDGDPEAVEALRDWLGNGQALQRARDEASARLMADRLDTRRSCPQILLQDKRGAIVADTNGSAGYLYVTGWLFDDLPEGHPTRGLEKVFEAQLKGGGS